MCIPLRLLLNFMEDKKAPIWRGYLICAMMLTCKICQLNMRVWIDFRNHKFSIRIKSAIVNSVFAKVIDS